MAVPGQIAPTAPARHTARAGSGYEAIVCDLDRVSRKHATANRVVGTFMGPMGVGHRRRHWDDHLVRVLSADVITNRSLFEGHQGFDGHSTEGRLRASAYIFVR